MIGSIVGAKRTPRRKTLIENAAKLSEIFKRQIMPTQFWAGRVLGTETVEIGKHKHEWDSRHGFKKTFMWVMPYKVWMEIFQVSIGPGQAVHMCLIVDSFERGANLTEYRHERTKTKLRRQRCSKDIA